METRAQLLQRLVKALPPEYKVHRASESDPDNSPAVLGAGGSSVVIQATYRDRLMRAVKIISPREDLLEGLNFSHFVQSYENEVVRLAALSHEHIAKITDFSVLTLEADAHYPYIATEYIDGPNLADYVSRPQTTGEDIIRVLTQILTALEYMHSQRVMHCDLKPDNIIIRNADGNRSKPPSAVIVDLGSSKYLPELPTKSQDEELLYLFSTHKYVIPELRLVLSNRTRNRISRRDLRRFFPLQDLFSFGAILQDLLDIPSVSPRLRRALGPTDYEAVDFLRRKLQAPVPGRYGQCSGVLEAVERLTKNSMAPLGIAELSPIPARGILIPTTRERAGGSDRVNNIVSHPLFQRLHRLPQLDLLDNVLPGATNTRFAHTLHTYELARSAISYLLADWRFRIDVSARDIDAILFSALLNGLGHYHFFHMFEDFIEEFRSEPLVRQAGLLRDSDVLDQVMGISEPKAAAGLAGLQDLRGRTLAEICQDSLDLEWSDVRRRQRHPDGPLESVLAALLACPVDVDKLAYLSDDSGATGLPFGRAIAPSPLFEALCLPGQDDWMRNSRPNPVILGVMEKAISYLESSVMIRYWNIQTGYWNRANRSLQAMVKYQIASLLRAGAFNFPSFLEETIHLSADGALRWLDAQFIEARRQQLIDPDSVNPLEELLISRRLIYKRLITISGKSRIASRAPDHRIFERLRAISPLRDDQVCEQIASVLHDVCTDLEIRPGEVLLDLPRARREEAGGRVLVYTDDKREQLGDLFTISPYLEQHRESFELHVKRLRVYLHPRVYDELSSRNLLDAAYDGSLQMLRSEYAT